MSEALKIKLQPWQDSFIFSLARFPALVSGWATGKTMCLIMAAIRHCELYPDALALLIRKDFIDLRDSTLKDFATYTAGTGLTVDSNKEVKFKNGSTLMFRHGDELEGLQNINLSWFGIEQGEELETDTQFTLLRGRLRRKQVPFHQGCLIANTNGHNWIWSLWKINATKDADFHLSEATSFDNKEHIAKKTLEDWAKLEIQQPAVYRRLVLNSWDDGDITSYIVPERFIRECLNVKLPPLLRPIKLIAIDPAGGGDDRAVMFALSNTRIVDSTILYTLEDKKVTCGHLNQLKVKTHSTHIAGDNIGVGWELFNELEQQGVNTLPLNSSESASNPKAYSNLKTEMWWNAREMFINHQVEMINDQELINELSIVKYTIDSNGMIKLESKDLTKKRLGRSPDKADAYVYGLWAHTKLNIDMPLDESWVVDTEPVKEDEMALGVRTE